MEVYCVRNIHRQHDRDTYNDRGVILQDSLYFTLYFNIRSDDLFQF